MRFAETHSCTTSIVPLFVRAFDLFGISQMHVAAIFGHSETLLAIVTKTRVDHTASDRMGNTAMHLLAARGHDEIAAWLVKVRCSLCMCVCVFSSHRRRRARSCWRRATPVGAPRYTSRRRWPHGLVYRRCSSSAQTSPPLTTRSVRLLPSLLSF